MRNELLNLSKSISSQLKADVERLPGSITPPMKAGTALYQSAEFNIFRRILNFNLPYRFLPFLLLFHRNGPERR
jgi:hypothetical protein